MKNLAYLLCLLTLLPCRTRAEPRNPSTDWFRDAQYGVFMHFLPGDARGLDLVEQFDVAALAQQLETAGANYFVITLGQNSGYFNSPNAAYDRYTGYAPGERCAKRDLPLDLYRALAPKGIKLMLYLPCQAPNGDARAQEAFGLRQGKQDQPLDLTFARKWAEVIQEWSERYGDKVAGWWFDGGYRHIGFNESIAAIYAKAAKRGNPGAIVTFNPGVQVIHYTEAEDYTAGELNEPFGQIPSSRWLNGSQWHALTFLGSAWARRDTRYSAKQWADWVKAVTAKGGVVTLDMGPNYDPQAGPVGGLASAQLAQVEEVKVSLASSATAPLPKRLKRAESYLGLHFDFHAGPDCTEIGKNTTREMVEAIINSAHPDYIQIDCKGHPGLSSYPTKVGNPAPGFVGDPLRIWREVTAKRGVALYMHYSGVWDLEAIRRHPDWAVVNSDGTTNHNATSFFSPYSDRLLIPQLRELAGEYGVDGAWVDGDCWGAAPDYGAAALRAFAAATGYQDVPRKPGDPHWFEFLQFNREAYRRYLRHYLMEVKRANPKMQLCSNWAFSDHMPEPVSAPIDWLSGDFSPEDSVNAGRFSARYLARQGKPWDLMAWSFTIHGQTPNGSNLKSAVQLEREAAVVLSQGGGFEFYYNQKRDGSVPEKYLPTITDVAAFCRARQPFCQGAIPVPQIALLYSTASHYREINGLFNRDLSRLSGTLQALLESQQVVDVVSEHRLAGRMSDYPLIVVGECAYLEPGFKQELIEYARNGGNLLVVGPQAAALFASELSVPITESNSQVRYLSTNRGLMKVNAKPLPAELDPRVGTLGRLYLSNDLAAPHQPAATLTRIGSGNLAATWFTFSREYLADRSPEMRDFLSDLARRLFPSPMVQVNGSADVDVCVNRLKEKLAINLINTSGPHWDQNHPLIDAIKPLGPLALTIHAEKKPSRVRLEPGDQPLDFDYQDQVIRVTIPELAIHSVVLVE
jgi:alpha-L-fucosidase